MNAKTYRSVVKSHLLGGRARRGGHWIGQELNEKLERDGGQEVWWSMGGTNGGFRTRKGRRMQAVGRSEENPNGDFKAMDEGLAARLEAEVGEEALHLIEGLGFRV